MSQSLKDLNVEQAYDLMFLNARTYNTWSDQHVDKMVLKQAYDLMKMAPTSANCAPLRLTFVTSTAEKERLKPFLAEGNVDKTMSAPVTALMASDMQFYEHLPFLFPHTDAKSWFTGNDQLITDTALRNATLQAGYFILAARSLGLDCGPMSGFDEQALNQEYYPDGRFKINLLCNLGYGTDEGLHPRTPRFDFDQVCEII